MTNQHNVAVPVVPHRLRLGVNYPWKNYGWDFAPPTATGRDRPGGLSEQGWWDGIEADLRHFKLDLGLFAVRWFILGDGRNYGWPRETRDGWEFDPPPLSPRFLEDFRILLQICSDQGIQLLPVLICPNWCAAGEEAQGPNDTRCIQGGRAEALTHSSKRERFLEHVLNPLLEVSGRTQYRSCIYAWEVMNEPEWAEQDYDIERAELISFLELAVDQINIARFKSTVGFARLNWAEEWGDLGVTLRQFHYYPRGNRLPDHSVVRRRSHPSRECILGEIATRVDLLPAWPGEDLPVLPAGGEVIYRRLRLIQCKGYPAAFLWAAKPLNIAARRWLWGWLKHGDNARDWSDGRGGVQEHIRRFTRGQ